MPKRECPFEYDLVVQSKIHVGEKEVNKGSLSERNMKAVYEKTLDLLYKGAKNAGVPESSDISSVNNKGPISVGIKPYKQMFLNNNGQLQESGSLMSLSISECELCLMSLQPCASQQCDFCDRRLCSSCTFVCNKCYDNFCQNCVLVTFSGPGDNIMCISCVH